ncbi:hypothetical protein DENSPDRAFT_885191 [Dentipellis sp. KUC8613]|nr:hypothetical protein DENSPDRAFT_885191 [Dentipellis sp. KUC8613]
MSLPDPVHPSLQRSDPARVQKHFDQQAQYFTICNLGRVPDPVNCSFVSRDGIIGDIYCEENDGVTLQYGIRIDFSAIVFEIVGRLAETDCFMTPEGDRNHPYGSVGDEAIPFASFWLQSPSESRRDVILWRRGLTQLERISRCAAGAGVAMGELVAPDYSQGSESPLALLQMGWGPPRPYTLEYLPVFTADHSHLPIPTLAAAPFGKRVSVRFTLHVKRGIRPVVGAHTLYMHVLD